MKKGFVVRTKATVYYDNYVEIEESTLERIKSKLGMDIPEEDIIISLYESNGCLAIDSDIVDIQDETALSAREVKEDEEY